MIDELLLSILKDTGMGDKGIERFRNYIAEHSVYMLGDTTQALWSSLWDSLMMSPCLIFHLIFINNIGKGMFTAKADDSVSSNLSQAFDEL